MLNPQPFRVSADLVRRWHPTVISTLRGAEGQPMYLPVVVPTPELEDVLAVALAEGIADPNLVGLALILHRGPDDDVPPVRLFEAWPVTHRQVHEALVRDHLNLAHANHSLRASLTLIEKTRWSPSGGLA